MSDSQATEEAKQPSPQYVEAPEFDQSDTPEGTPVPQRDENHQKELAKLSGLSHREGHSVDAQPTVDKPLPKRNSVVSAAGATNKQVKRHRTPEERAEEKERREKLAKEKQLQYELKIGVKKAYLLIIPVSICMAAVIICLKILENEDEPGGNSESFGYTPYEDNDEEQSAGDQLGGAALNALILLAIIVGLTFGLVICYKNEWYKAIHGWLVLSTVLLVYFFSYSFMVDLLWATNTPMSWPTLILIVYNFGTAGMFAIHWKSALIVQQFYLISVSCLMAMVFIKYLPDWTTWIVLGLMAVYDLVAVLCPFGPLRMLVETAQKREQPLFPALIYSSSMVWLINMADVPDGTNSKPAKVLNPTMSYADESKVEKGEQGKSVCNADDDEEENTGVKLGLGDFIFYSILVGKASQESTWGVVIACYVCIVVGLVITIFILCIAKKALPALPFSIFLALSFFFATRPTIEPYTHYLSEHMIMI